MPTLSPSYAPPGETAAELWLERAIMNGAILMCVAYGIYFTLFCQCASALFWQNGKSNPKTRTILIAFLLLDFALVTISTGAEIKYNQMTFIDDRNIEGGPAAFAFEFASYWVSMLANATFFVANWLADGLLLYRYCKIWTFKFLVVVIPSLMYLGSIVTSIFLMVIMTSPGGSIWSDVAVQFGIAYWSLTISLNLIITLLICIRLFVAKKELQGVLGSGHGKVYSSMTAMLVESASIYSAWGLVFLIAYAKNNTVEVLVSSALCPVQGIASTLILLRVAQGTAWSPSNSTAVGTTSTAKFMQVMVSQIRETSVNFPSEHQMSDMKVDSDAKDNCGSEDAV